MAYSYRCIWENDFQWKARRQFLDLHEGKFSDSRLASLSMAWANWKFMGCEYPSEVQDLLRQLDEDMPEDFDMHTKDKISGFRKTRKSKKQPGLTWHEQRTVNKSTVRRVGFQLYVPSSDSLEWNAVSVLNTSAQKSRSSIEFKDSCCPDTSGNGVLFASTVVIDSKSIVTGYGNSKKVAKHDAAGKAIEILKLSNPVIVKSVDHDNLEVISKGDLIKNAYENAPKIAEDNIGNQLLKKMGWSGLGGIGKAGNTGRVDPIFVNIADGRKGLGAASTSREKSLHRETAEGVLLKFLKDDTQTDLRFTQELSKIERATLHKLSQKYGLGHKSYGTDEQRYLVISKKS